MNMYIELLLFYITIISVTSQHDPNQTIPSVELSDRKSVDLTPKPAGCTPTLQEVKLQSSKSDNPNYFVFPLPPYAQVEQCGGYCPSSLQSCQPIETEIVTFEVYIEKKPLGQLDPERNVESVPVEKHTKCRCGCKIKPEHCNALQRYSEDDCQCECSNTEERVYCKWNDKKWDAEKCECV